MRDFRKIDAWRLAGDFAVAIFQGTRTFPHEELYGLTCQLRRAASSVPANIVEGSARESRNEYLHFLHIARGSLAEAQYFVHLASRLGYLDDASSVLLTAQGRQVFACLHGLIVAVGKEARRLPARPPRSGDLAAEETQEAYPVGPAPAPECFSLRSSRNPVVL
ncbi:MAG TPA: four helix bundle protein [Candidatus Didemnitutus sp.]|jgi:four helix bundle protein